MTDHMTTRQKQIPNRIDVLVSMRGDMSIDSQGSPLNGGKGDIHVEYVRENSIESLTAELARQVQRTDEQREAYEQALSVMEADNERLRAALFAWIDMMNDPSTKLRRKVVEFYSIAIAALK